VGSTKWKKAQFRVISATNQPLSDLTSHGRFRNDLLYRLSDMVLWIPPLRDHMEDIPELAYHFVRKYSTAPQSIKISDTAIGRLMQNHWPGNIRQLESTMKRAVVFARGPIIEDVEIYDPLALNPTPAISPVTDGAGSLEEKMALYERSLIEDCLKKHAGNKSATMEELGLSRATFYRKVQSLRIPLR